MKPTLKDLMALDYFQNLKIIAGSEGLNKEFVDCGFLDYEYDKILVNRYFYTNFHKGQLALTSFLYARDNPSLILDAIKYLIKKEACGLIIKNVFNLPIHDSVIRYADSMKFPIFILPKTDIYFEEIIIESYKFSKGFGDNSYRSEIIGNMLSNILSDPKEVEKSALSITQLFKDEIVCGVVDLKFSQDIDYSQLSKLQDMYMAGKNDFTLILYKSCLYLIYSYAGSHNTQSIEYLNSEMDNLVSALNITHYSMGVSKTHSSLRTFNIMLQEATLSATMAASFGMEILSYGNLGAYQFVFPLAKELPMVSFSKGISEPLMDFDIENRTKLLDTFLQLSLPNHTMEDMSKNLSQHPNTIRYRFKQIQQLTGLNFFNNAHYQQLALAAQIFHVLSLN